MALSLISNDSLFPLNVGDFIWSKSAIYLHIGIYPPYLLLCNYYLLQDSGRVVQNICLQEHIFFHDVCKYSESLLPYNIE